MFGLTGYLGIALAASLAATAAAGWLAWHEHGIAVAQASVDRARIAQVQATATAGALKEQQAIDAKELAAANKRRAQAEQAAAIARATTAAALAHATAAQESVRQIIRQEGPTACAKQAIPAPILSQLNGGA